MAEDMFLGKIGSGAYGDIKAVTSYARTMVTRLGMSRKLGPIAYEEGSSRCSWAGTSGGRTCSARRRCRRSTPRSSASSTSSSAGAHDPRRQPREGRDVEGRPARARVHRRRGVQAADEGPDPARARAERRPLGGRHDRGGGGDVDGPRPATTTTTAAATAAAAGRRASTTPLERERQRPSDGRGPAGPFRAPAGTWACGVSDDAPVADGHRQPDAGQLLGRFTRRRARGRGGPGPAPGRRGCRPARPGGRVVATRRRAGR